MRFLFPFLFVLFAFAGEVRVATYNVENLFDVTVQGTEYERYIPQRNGWNVKTYRTKLTHIAEVLCDTDADVVGLQEIENGRVLNDLQRVLKRAGCAYPYAAVTHKIGAPVQTALLSRYRIVRSRDLRVSYAPRVRNILEAVVATPIGKMRIFVNHWKSKAREGFESKRIAYAKTLRRRLMQLDPKEPIVVLGDFNSDYNAYLTLEKRNNDTQGKTGINDILPTMRNGLPVGESDMLHTKRWLLYDLWYEVPLSKRWSQKFYGKRSTPDHILLSPGMFDGKGIDYLNGSFKVFKADYLFTQKGYINRWEVKHGKHTGRGYSDHLPLTATFSDKPYRPAKNDRTFFPPQTVTIDALYGDVDKECAYKLKRVAVVYKRGNHAVVKQHGAKRGIFIYGSAGSLRQGECYDLIVEGIQSYKGLREVTAAYPVASYGKCDISAFVHEGNAYLRNAPEQNEVIADVTGVYKRRYFYLEGGGKIRIYFKKRSFVPAEGAHLKIFYARLGYYKGVEIVIDRRKDFATE
jgi:endonuclease/exonuclease/phosphatase family metal-dependent hydrolase